MMPFSRLLRLSLAMSLFSGAALILPGCASDKQPESFAPLTYAYLNKLNLNVSRIDIIDKAASSPIEGNIAASAPVPPEQALRQMAQDRLSAVGTNSDTAKFEIDRASILNNSGGNLAGQMDVSLSILNPEGLTVASTKTHVTRLLRPSLSEGNADSPANLYALTREMMQDMNVELEYQLHHNMGSWLLDGGGKPLNSAVQSQSLGLPGSTPPQAITAAPAAASATPSATPGSFTAPAASASNASATLLPSVPSSSQQNAVTVVKHTPEVNSSSVTQTGNAPLTLTPSALSSVAPATSSPAPAATTTPAAEPDPVFPAGN